MIKSNGKAFIVVKFDTVIFDLDGTLLDTLPDLHAAVNYALQAHSMTSRSIDDVRRFVGNGIANLIKRAVPEGTDEKATSAVLDDFKIYYGAHCTVLTHPYTGINELLLRLKAENIKLAVVSNKAQFATSAIVEKYFANVFNVVFGEREGIPRKPAPDSVNEALELLCAKNALYVGDSDVDIQTAKNSFLPCASVTWGFRDKETLTKAGASLFAFTADELYRIITEEKQCTYQ